MFRPPTCLHSVQSRRFSRRFAEDSQAPNKAKYNNEAPKMTYFVDNISKRQKEKNNNILKHLVFCGRFKRYTTFDSPWHEPHKTAVFACHAISTVSCHYAIVYVVTRWRFADTFKIQASRLCTKKQTRILRKTFKLTYVNKRPSLQLHRYADFS